ncbi:hypothetical protein CVU76_02890 [Candidatus Dojkabacteria bacterium HGW-Dojkabacteria-1]|uniref:Uncharacterized protein n=1 Tax=Candidatus Dojkabacteria bacterium HGW-Dojkabacteria-1 TaxID=2013761 RepID=A0A2N2F467_9BACT|nr:MAG: hypothetical protein CVU76_02890 [Candidatus Dojkabacteria bacterium HGW-Dojkabacteria-1]
MIDLKKEIMDKGGKFKYEKLLNGELFEYVIIDNLDRIITLAVNNGYVLHGSTRKLVELIPQEANDSSKEFGNAKAVYLTSNPIVAKFCALVGGANVGERRDSKVTKISPEGEYTYTDTFFGVSKPENIRNEGYIYIFPKSVVDKSEGLEHISKEPIKPFIVIQMKRSDWDEKKYPIEKI